MPVVELTLGESQVRLSDQKFEFALCYAHQKNPWPFLRSRDYVLRSKREASRKQATSFECDVPGQDHKSNCGFSHGTSVVSPSGLRCHKLTASRCSSAKTS